MALGNFLFNKCNSFETCFVWSQARPRTASARKRKYVFMRLETKYAGEEKAIFDDATDCILRFLLAASLFARIRNNVFTSVYLWFQ